MQRFFRAPVLAVSLAVALSGQQSGSYTVTTIAGAPRVLADGVDATTVHLLQPRGLALDGSGNLLVADSANHKVWRISPAGIITTVAGTGAIGFSGDDGQGVAARLNGPEGVVVDAAGNVYIADTGNHRVRRVNASGVITTVAGTGVVGFGGDNGLATGARMNFPSALALDDSGNVFVTEREGNRVRKFAPGGSIVTIAGIGQEGFDGDDGLATEARISNPLGVAFRAGKLYVADTDNHRIRRIDEGGIITTVAGTGLAGYNGDGTPATTVRFTSPAALFFDLDGNLLITEATGHRLRRLEPSGRTLTLAGTGVAGFAGDGDVALAAHLNLPLGVVMDSRRNIYLTDSNNHRIRRVAAAVITTIAGAPPFTGDAGSALSAQIRFPSGMALDAAGNIFISDTSNRRVRKLTIGGGIITVAGSATEGFGGDGAAATLASLQRPMGLALDVEGSLYIADTNNHRVRKVTTEGLITTVAGSEFFGFAGDGGAATQARLRNPTGVAVDAAGTLYIADTLNRRIRSVVGGIIAPYAGSGVFGFGGDGGGAISARFTEPTGIGLDGIGNMVLADVLNHRIRRITAQGIISTVAGAGSPPGFSGDGGRATAARLTLPLAAAADPMGNIYIADTANHRIRKVTPDGIIFTIGGTGTPSFGGDGGPANLAGFNSPAAIGVDAEGNVYVADRDNHRIRKLSPVPPVGLQMVSGDGQSAIVGTRLPRPLVVRLVGQNNLPLQGAVVAFTVTEGSALLSNTQASTSADGMASVEVTLGNTPGVIRITAAVAGLPAVTFTLTAAGVPPPPPMITAVVGAGLSVPSVTRIAPNGLITIFGQRFAPAGTVRRVAAEDLVDGRIPTRFAGVCVEINGQRAPVFQVLATQVSAIVPLGIRLSATVQVLANCGEANEVRSTTLRVTVDAAAPELLYWVANADGRNPVVAVDSVTGDYIGPPGLIPDVTFRPARPADVLTIYGVGYGETNPSFPAGQPPDRAGATLLFPTVTLNGVVVRASDVLYVGVTGGVAGLYQVNLRLPDDLADGTYTIRLFLGGFTSPTGAFLVVKQ